MMNDCKCKECNPRKLKDYLIYLLPAAVIVLGLVQFSAGSVLAGIGLSYLIKKIRKLEIKIDNCECWY